MYRVLITGKLAPIGIEKLQQEPDLQIDYYPDLPYLEVLQQISQYECLIVRSETPVTRELIEHGQRLKVIACAAVGIAHIDVEYATQRGILVMNTPGKNTNSAAELTLALLLAVTRKIVLAHKNMENGRWDRHQFTGTELMNKTIGIIGLGNVGHRVARFARGLDMQVLAYDPYIPDTEFERHRAQKVDFHTLLKESDIITVHVPKNKETIGMIGKPEFQLMKKGVFILNTARGGIINEQALYEALLSGQVAGAGIDTWEQEPPSSNIFAHLPNVVMTPHIGASTEEAQIRIALTIAEQVPRALRGGIVDYPVNMPQIRAIEGNLMSTYTVLSEKLGLFAAQYANFQPYTIEIFYRGDLVQHDCRILRLAFLKGFLGYHHPYVTYVNADQRAKSCGIDIREIADPDFSDYENAIKFNIVGQDKKTVIGGVVFPGPHMRITLIDGFVYEEDPSGTFLILECEPKIGIVAQIASLLDQRKVIILNFSFAYDKKRKRNMFLIKTMRPLQDRELEVFHNQPDILSCRQVIL